MLSRFLFAECTKVCKEENDSVWRTRFVGAHHAQTICCSAFFTFVSVMDEPPTHSITLSNNCALTSCQQVLHFKSSCAHQNGYKNRSTNSRASNPIISKSLWYLRAPNLEKYFCAFYCVFDCRYAASAWSSEHKCRRVQQQRKWKVRVQQDFRQFG